MDITKNRRVVKTFDYDGAFKLFIEHMSDEQLIKFVNAAYKRDLPLNSKVTKLWTESNVKKRRLSDLYLRIGNSTFNMEVPYSPYLIFS